MAIAIFQNQNDKLTWITVDIEGNTAKIQVLPLTSKEDTKIYQKAAPYERVKGELVRDPDITKYREEKFCKIVKAWEGITDAEGNELPCNDANKLLVIRHNNKLAKEIIDRTEEIGDSFIVKKEESEKN